VRPQAQHEALQETRHRQATTEWKAAYDRRAGIEGTVSEGVRAYGLRRCRYRGLAKTRLQHLLTAAAMNWVRMAHWIEGKSHAPTRMSRFSALAT
jgi:transposase